MCGGSESNSNPSRDSGNRSSFTDSVTSSLTGRGQVQYGGGGFYSPTTRSSPESVSERITDPSTTEGVWDALTGTGATVGSSAADALSTGAQLSTPAGMALGMLGRVVGAMFDDYDYFESVADNRARAGMERREREERQNAAREQAVADLGTSQPGGTEFTGGDNPLGGSGGDRTISQPAGRTAQQAKPATVEIAAAPATPAAAKPEPRKRGTRSTIRTGVDGVTGTANILRYALGGI